MDVEWGRRGLRYKLIARFKDAVERRGDAVCHGDVTLECGAGHYNVRTAVGGEAKVV